MTLEEINAIRDRDEKFLEIFGYEYHENCVICKALWEKHLELVRYLVDRPFSGQKTLVSEEGQ